MLKVTELDWPAVGSVLRPICMVTWPKMRSQRAGCSVASVATMASGAVVGPGVPIVSVTGEPGLPIHTPRTAALGANEAPGMLSAAKVGVVSVTTRSAIVAVLCTWSVWVTRLAKLPLAASSAPAMCALPVTSRSPCTWRLPGMIVATASAPSAASIFSQFAFSAASVPRARWSLGVSSCCTITCLGRGRGRLAHQVFERQDGSLQLVGSSLREIEGALQLGHPALLGRQLRAVGFELGGDVHHAIFAFQASRHSSEQHSSTTISSSCVTVGRFEVCGEGPAM